MLEIILGFVIAIIVACIVTAMFADCAGDRHPLTYIVAGCSFGSAIAIILAGIVLLFI